LIAAIVFGLAPALQLTAKRRSGTRARQMLVMAQIAASCVLLIVAGLLVRALHFAVSTDPATTTSTLWSSIPILQPMATLPLLRGTISMPCRQGYGSYPA
jgi:hypothetical protein